MATTSLALLDHQTLQLPSPPAVAYNGGRSDRLSQEIFSILESNFLFGASPLEGGGACSAGRVRVLSIDGGADGGALAAAALVRLERRLQELSGNTAARVTDFFDLAAGSRAGGFLAAALLTCRMPAEAAREFVAKNSKVLSGGRGGGLMSMSFWRARPEALFRKVFGDLTVRDAAADPVLRHGERGAVRVLPRRRRGGRRIRLPTVAAHQAARRGGAAGAGGGGVSAVVANPMAVALMHVLHNKREFPFVAGAADLAVLSLGGSAPAAASSLGRPSSSSLLRIAGACQADMVDQAVSMAFGESRATNYVRIQGNGITPGETAEAALAERGVESVLFRGKKLMAQTNGERLDAVAEQLVQEHHRRLESKTAVVLVKPSATPRTSSSSASTLITVSTNSSSESP
ncbi:unnamed protein product [Miscanthus lutarioriparius]|uniref:PNPLA domain-containing protein n=1 Tax=Miscanthus lutarioriparius TaxID=422564 RepID=A0A811SMA7_9POAL|nr:unnamed protein product [Miscanthus lutarioriparius]